MKILIVLGVIACLVVPIFVGLAIRGPSPTQQRIEAHRKWLAKMRKKRVLLPKPLCDDRSSIEINRRILAQR